MKVIARRIAAGATPAVAPALLALGVAAGSHAAGSVGQNYADGVNGTVVKPGTPEHHKHQKNKSK